jgi:hypothetical protein
MKIIAAAVPLIVAGCTDVSPVMPTGNNSYMVSVVSHSQWRDAVIKATTDANAYCTTQGKKAVINHMDTAGTQFMISFPIQ